MDGWTIRFCPCGDPARNCHCRTCRSGDAFYDLFCLFDGLLKRSMRQINCQFFPAPSCCNISGADHILDKIGHLDQKIITSIVAICIIHFFEIIDIDQDEASFGISQDMFTHPFIQITSGIKIGQIIRYHQFFQPLLQHGIDNR